MGNQTLLFVLDAPKAHRARPRDGVSFGAVSGQPENFGLNCLDQFAGWSKSDDAVVLGQAACTGGGVNYHDSAAGRGQAGGKQDSPVGEGTLGPGAVG